MAQHQVTGDEVARQASLQPPVRRRWLMLLWLVVLLPMVVVALRAPGSRTAQTVGDLLVLVSVLVAVASCAIAVRRARADRAGWVVLTLTAACWAIAQTIYTSYGIARDHDYPFPSVADVFYLGFAAPAVIALLLLARQGRRQVSAGASLLDAAVIALGTLILSWTTVLREVVPRGGESGDLRAWVTLAYPALDVLILSLVLALAMRSPVEESLRWLLLGGGLGILAITDSLFVHALDSGHPGPTGTLLGAGWICSWFLVALSPWAPVRPVRPRRRRLVSLSLDLVPYVPVLAAVLALGRVDITDDQFLLTAGVLLLIAVAARQVLVVRRNVDFTHELETQVAARTAELELARGEAIEASRQKSEFLATMSHEIRTPMNGVIGLTGLLLNTQLDERQRQYAAGVRQAGESLLGIINDILDFSKIEAGRLEIEVIDFDVVQVVEEAAELVAQAAHDKGLELVTHCSPDLPQGLRGDPARLRQILLNLAANAVKFTTEGEVVVRATLDGHTGDGVVARFEVADTGIGIDEESRKRVFEPFLQEDASTTRRFGGTGLGLAICRQLVTALGGTLGVESTSGTGSTFWFTLPLALADEPAVVHRRPPEGLAGVRVLLVDDNATNRLILAEQLGAWGMRPDAVGDGRTGLRLIAEAAASGDPYRWALLDLCMPDLDGIALAQRISDLPQSDRPQLVLLSSDMEIDTEGARDAGVSACLTKPVQVAQLQTVLQARRRASPVTEDVTAPAAPVRRGHVLVVEDNHVNQMVAVGMLDHMGYSSEVAGDGVEALAALDHRAFDAILMDCQMPEMDGYDATRAIRLREGTRTHTPIIAMTAFATEGERERCLAAGMDDFITKPARPTELAATLQRWLETSSPSAAATAVETPVLDEQRLELLRQLAADGAGLLPRLVAEFTDSAPRELALLQQAITAGDADEIAVVAHRLKDSALNLGVQRVVSRLVEVERLAAAADLGAVGAVAEPLGRELDEASLALRRASEEQRS